MYIYSEVNRYVLIFQNSMIQMGDYSKEFFKQSVRERKEACYHGSHPGEEEEGSFPPTLVLLQKKHVGYM
jgi:hypothetical protein